MYNIHREITLLKERQINWTKEIENMDTKIKDLMNSLDLTQETKNEIKLQNQNKIKNDDIRNVREWRVFGQGKTKISNICTSTQIMYIKQHNIKQ